jgi:t-SNARE complex subunit (syntaxin)
MKCIYKYNLLIVILDNIERNVTSVAIHTQRASDEVATASRYQRRARKLMCYLLLILSTILAFVILLVLVV